MPSLHTGWSTWCAFVLFPMVRRRWLKALIVLYPVATVFCIMITGNHYWLDAAGGLVVFSLGRLIGRGLSQWLRSMRQTDTASGTPFKWARRARPKDTDGRSPTSVRTSTVANT